ncbi:MAG: galactokinase [Anaerolineae bacterium]|jgi:galactokinase|nr:galactokinase [Anaerolineae bacterium]MBT7069909.1 galactokinase [Anaerolineae bacterium]MBT7323860.1 galactokinase [Anaerolineae bacterium]
MQPPSTLQQLFQREFSTFPTFIVRAPGRVNLLGEHTDYNDGFVLPMAIEHAVWIALRPREDRQVHIYAQNFDEKIIFSLDSLEKNAGWGEYLKGVAHALQKASFLLKGWDGVMFGNVPVGAGLSSSAAVEIAATRTFALASDYEWNARQMALIGQRAEVDWVGVNSGIMDQMVSAAARAGHALFLDTRSLEYEHIPLPKEAAIIVMDTSTRRGLVDSAYNTRRAECEQASKTLGVAALRDANLTVLNERRGELEEQVFRRARHVISENQRVLDAISALRAGDLAYFGKLFNASHNSLRDDFEVTNDALNWIVGIAQSQPGCYGARMTGAGFGGAAVALVKREELEAFSQAVKSEYKLKSGLDAQLYICEASAGTSIEKS